MGFVTYGVLSDALDDVVKVSSGLLPILGKVLHLHLSLLREDVLLDVVILVRHIADGPLLCDGIGLLSSKCPHFLVCTFSIQINY